MRWQFHPLAIQGIVENQKKTIPFVIVVAVMYNPYTVQLLIMRFLSSLYGKYLLIDMAPSSQHRLYAPAPPLLVTPSQHITCTIKIRSTHIHMYTTHCYIHTILPYIRMGSWHCSQMCTNGSLAVLAQKLIGWFHVSVLPRFSGKPAESVLHTFASGTATTYMHASH